GRLTSYWINCEVGSASLSLSLTGEETHGGTKAAETAIEKSPIRPPPGAPDCGGAQPCGRAGLAAPWHGRDRRDGRIVPRGNLCDRPLQARDLGRAAPPGRRGDAGRRGRRRRFPARPPVRCADAALRGSATIPCRAACHSTR